MKKIALHWQILIAIALAGVAGFLVNYFGKGDPTAPAFLGVSFLTAFDYIGEMFLNALKMIIVPLITSSIIVGMAGIGSSGNLGALGGRTLAFYAVTTTAAILVGLLLINAVGPGYADGQPVGESLALDTPAGDIAARVEGKGAGDVAEIFLRMVPPNVVMAAAEGQMLGIIFFALLFGFFMTKLDHELAEPMFKFWDGVFHVMMRMTEWIMKFAPIGVFGLVAAVVAESGFEAGKPLAIFALTVLAALAVHTFVTLPVLMRAIGRVNPWKMYPAMAPAMLTAFSTASSSAALPVTMDCVEKNVGVSNKISSFVLPLGATVNMNGTALYECAAALFLAQAYGLDLTFGVQFSIVVIALMTSIGVAGVPSASLVAIAIILGAIGLPAEAIGVLMVFDRILDMVRTSVNIFGDACCAVIVARLQGEETNIALGS
ncbi:MAG: dicarboxylate/amino acid:cation symporter [Gammaproteobacteria bacterium]|nr:dicarboxylate/amino acid:cation symporter [Gammaproteobacteria bacterium]MDH4316137.1 dicarboxylate/amino acid:cation symporter [Gammaproteobacteria bacterium]MDH5214898.1 dicarboxylate/amino acid:cation symporter [Gammaproteobacteria bacterium]